MVLGSVVAIVSSSSVVGSCDGLNVIGSHKRIGSGTVGRCSLVDEAVALLREVCHGEGRL